MTETTYLEVFKTVPKFGGGRNVLWKTKNATTHIKSFCSEVLMDADRVRVQRKGMYIFTTYVCDRNNSREQKSAAVAQGTTVCFCVQGIFNTPCQNWKVEKLHWKLHVINIIHVKYVKSNKWVMRRWRLPRAKPRRKVGVPQAARRRLHLAIPSKRFPHKRTVDRAQPSAPARWLYTEYTHYNEIITSPFAHSGAHSSIEMLRTKVATWYLSLIFQSLC